MVGDCLGEVVSEEPAIGEMMGRHPHETKLYYQLNVDQRLYDAGRQPQPASLPRVFNSMGWPIGVQNGDYWLELAADSVYDDDAILPLS